MLNYCTLYLYLYILLLFLCSHRKEQNGIFFVATTLYITSVHYQNLHSTFAGGNFTCNFDNFGNIISTSESWIIFKKLKTCTMMFLSSFSIKSILSFIKAFSDWLCYSLSILWEILSRVALSVCYQNDSCFLAFSKCKEDLDKVLNE